MPNKAQRPNGDFSRIQTTTMLHQAFHELTIATHGRGLYEFTDAVAAWITKGSFQHGLVTLHLRHTSASLLIQENADPDVRTDLTTALARLAPADARWVHDAEGPDDMPAHVKTMLTGVSLHVPVAGGKLALGTWQGVYLWEHRRRGSAREVLVHVST